VFLVRKTSFSLPHVLSLQVGRLLQVVVVVVVIIIFFFFFGW